MTMQMQRRRLLILENDPGLRRELELVFADLEVTFGETSAKAALALLRRIEPDAVLLDLGSAGELADQRLDLLKQMLSLAPGTRVIAMADPDERALMAAALGLGATDFFHKPLDPRVLSLVVRRALRIRELEEEDRRLRERTGAMVLPGVIGACDAMVLIGRTVSKAAPTSASVLLLGESGTGKALLARALHRLSPRADREFVVISCAAAADGELERQLERARGGTVLLDEISELSSPLQARLLSVLQDGTADLRLVSTGGPHLEAAAGEGRFRSDLFYRLGEVTIRVPPLAERQGDSLLLAQFLLQEAASGLGRAMRGLSADAVRALQAHPWPGNVRELESRLKAAVIMAEGTVVTAADLGLTDPSEDPDCLNLRVARQRAEMQAVRQALAVTRANLSQASQLLGVTRPTLYHLLEKHQIDATQFA